MKIGDSTYYCWNCDAHRHIAAKSDKKICCPSCGSHLEDDSPVTLTFPAQASESRFADEYAFVRFAS